MLTKSRQRENLENVRKFLERLKYNAQNKKEIIHKLFSEIKVANKTPSRYKQENFEIPGEHHFKSLHM